MINWLMVNQKLAKEKAAGASKDASDKSYDVAVTTAYRINTANKRKRSTKNQVTNSNGKRAASAKLSAGVDKEAKSVGQQHDIDSESDDGTEYLSEGGEGRFISPGSKRFAVHTEPSTDDEREVTRLLQHEKLLEAQLEPAVISKQNELDHCQELLNKLKEEMKPLLKLLKEKTEARRQQEAESKKQLQEQKEAQEEQRRQQQQQQQQQQQKQQQKQAHTRGEKTNVKHQQYKKQQQQIVPITANGSTGAPATGASSSGAQNSAVSNTQIQGTERSTTPAPAPATASRLTAAKQQHQQQPRNKSEKVPPIRTYRVDIADIKQVCKSATNNKFEIKIINEKQKRYSVQCFTMAEYKFVKECLKEATAEFFSFTPRSEKPKTVLLKGISSFTEPEELLAELRQKASDDLEFIGVKPFTTVKSRREGHNLPIFIVTLSPQSRLESLKKITILDYQVIHWDKLKRHDDMLQCMRCQRFGHAAANCEMQLRCVKCAETHNRGECRLGNERVEDLTKLKCVICGNEGHPANYRGCPKVQEIREKQAKQKATVSRPVRQAPTTAQSSIVNPNISFANVARGRANTRQALPPVATQAQEPKAPAERPDIVALLLSIQGQLTGLQSQIREQGERVDYLYSLLPGQAQHQG